jgi:hypothetical protein
MDLRPPATGQGNLELGREPGFIPVSSRKNVMLGQIALIKNKDVPLMGKIHIRTANQEGTADSPLRYYIYAEEPCKC